MEHQRRATFRTWSTNDGRPDMEHQGGNSPGHAAPTTPAPLDPAVTIQGGRGAYLPPIQEQGRG